MVEGYELRPTLFSQLQQSKGAVVVDFEVLKQFIVEVSVRSTTNDDL